ncbi:MAG: hypothetical protein LIP06_09710 [Tannerellaceae bacterium]|nr:hypothetical protein [Tannerellaceae bacterium]
MEHQQGRPPTEEEFFYTTWGKETLKNNINLCNDILKQLITLSTTLLGVTIIFDTIITVYFLKLLVMVLFFASLIIAFLGILPYERKVILDAPQDIKTHKEKTLKHKRTYLWSSAFCLVSGIGTIIGELIVGFFSKT